MQSRNSYYYFSAFFISTSLQKRQAMKIINIDHFVITTTNLEKCLAFYVGVLGMEHRTDNGHNNLYFSGGKISLHTTKGEFSPSARNPQYGSQDFCLIVDADLNTLKEEIEEQGIEIVEGIVTRHGSKGIMKSIYLHDPDGNLVELSCY